MPTMDITLRHMGRKNIVVPGKRRMRTLNCFLVTKGAAELLCSRNWKKVKHACQCLSPSKNYREDAVWVSPPRNRYLRYGTRIKLRVKLPDEREINQFLCDSRKGVPQPAGTKRVGLLVGELTAAAPYFQITPDCMMRYRKLDDGREEIEARLGLCHHAVTGLHTTLWGTEYEHLITEDGWTKKWLTPYPMTPDFQI